MLILQSLLAIVHGVLAVAMIALILLQQGKGADAGASFGGGASGTVFGSTGSGNFLSRLTGALATLFLINCLALAWLGKQQVQRESLLDSVPIEAEADADSNAAGDSAASPAQDDAETAASDDGYQFEAADDGEQQQDAAADEGNDADHSNIDLETDIPLLPDDSSN